MNIAGLLASHLGTRDDVLYRQHVDGGWRDYTAGEVAALAARWQAAYRASGLAPGDRVGICLRNGLSWVAADLAALGLGLVVVPLYVDDNAESIAYCIEHSGARIVIVGTSRMAADLAALAVDREHLVVASPDADAKDDRAIDDFLPATAPPFHVDPVPAETLATICYTSGTAGRPKGVMLSHGNILANVEGALATGMAREEDVFLSFLPLSHMFERTGGYYLPLKLGAKVVYARSIAQLAEDLASERPTAVFAVPRVFDKFAHRIHQAVAKSARNKWLLERCVSAGYRMDTGTGSAVDALVANVLRPGVAGPILARLGGRLRLAVVGGAALDPDVARLFVGLGLPMLQGYGLTEASPVVSVNRLGRNHPESVGEPLENVEVRLTLGGELLVRGPNVMLGYWRDPEATARALNHDGWLHTGDLAEFQAGRIQIHGRLKDILVLSNGEKLPPQDAELAILGDETFEQVILVGEGRPFLTLIAVTAEQDEKKLVKRANERLKHFPKWVHVRRVIPTGEAWSVENGLATPTLKVKRDRVIARHAEALRQIYAGAHGRESREG